MELRVTAIVVEAMWVAIRCAFGLYRSGLLSKEFGIVERERDLFPIAIIV